MKSAIAAITLAIAPLRKCCHRPLSVERMPPLVLVAAGDLNTTCTEAV